MTGTESRFRFGQDTRGQFFAKLPTLLLREKPKTLDMKYQI